MNFQHTEQKLVYFLLKNNGEKLRYHINQALVKISPAIGDNISLYYNNIVGLMLHVHTRLDVCENCNDSLILFRKNALSILNTPPEKEDDISFAAEGTAGVAMVSAAQEDITSAVLNSVPAATASSFPPIINAPVLVTVSSRARNDTNREIIGYDKYWDRDIDHKKHGHIVVQLKPETEIQVFEPRRDLGNIEIIDIKTASTMKKAASSVATPSSFRVVDYIYTSPNCHSIFPDVLQRFVFR